MYLIQKTTVNFQVLFFMKVIVVYLESFELWLSIIFFLCIYVFKFSFDEKSQFFFQLLSCIQINNHIMVSSFSFYLTFIKNEIFV